MKPKVLMPKVAAELTDNYLAKKGYDVVMVDNPGEAELLTVAPDAAAVMMISKKLSNQIYEQMPNLKVLARRGVGYDNIDVNAAAEHGVWVTNTPGANARSVAEAALMDMMMLARQFRAVDQRTRQGGWAGAYQLMGHDLSGATVGIIGFGHVGQALAKLLTSFGVRTLINARQPVETTLGTFVDRETLFREADFVSINVAANAETFHSIDETAFKLMKPTAFLVNLARGAIVDESAMIHALSTGEIAGAALDVFEVEPLPQNSPLYQLDNVILTPHVGANTVEANREMAMTASKMIDLVLTGQTPTYAVNQPKMASKMS